MIVKRIGNIADQIKMERLEAENAELQEAVIELAQLLSDQEDALVELAGEMEE